MVEAKQEAKQEVKPEAKEDSKEEMKVQLALMQQVEYYLSESNLKKDKYFNDLLREAKVSSLRNR